MPRNPRINMKLKQLQRAQETRGTSKQMEDLNGFRVLRKPKQSQNQGETKTV